MTANEVRISDWSSDVCSSDLPGPVALVEPGLGSLMGFRPDRRGELRVDQILHAPLHQPAEQVGRIRVPQARDKVSNSGIIFMGHRVVISFSGYLPVITESHAMAHPTGGPPTSPPPLPGTRPTCGCCQGEPIAVPEPPPTPPYVVRHSSLTRFTHTLG